MLIWIGVYRHLDFVVTEFQVEFEVCHLVFILGFHELAHASIAYRVCLKGHIHDTLGQTQAMSQAEDTATIDLVVTQIESLKQC